MEVYESNKIHFLAPLSCQEDFFVPEALMEEEEEEEVSSEGEGDSVDLTEVPSTSGVNSKIMLIQGQGDTSQAPQQPPLVMPVQAPQQPPLVVPVQAPSMNLPPGINAGQPPILPQGGPTLSADTNEKVPVVVATRLEPEKKVGAEGGQSVNFSPVPSVAVPQQQPLPAASVSMDTQQPATRIYNTVVEPIANQEQQIEAPPLIVIPNTCVMMNQIPQNQNVAAAAKPTDRQSLPKDKSATGSLPTSGAESSFDVIDSPNVTDTSYSELSSFEPSAGTSGLLSESSINTSLVELSSDDCSDKEH
jgi:hypothetical protein